METTQIIENLKKEAKDNPVANAVFHAWAVRERTRHHITLEALTAKMHKEGYPFKPAEYAALLDRLAKLGFGKLEYSNGRVKALSGVKTTLQSIGAAALGERFQLEDKAQKHRFHALATRSEAFKVVRQEVEKKPVEVKLVVDIGGKPIEIPIPTDMRSDDIAKLIAKLRG